MQGMLSFLIVVVILLIAVVAVGLAVLSQVAKRLTQATLELDKKLTRLEGRVASQDAAIAGLRKSMDQQSADPVMEVVRALQGWKKNGPWQTVAALGSRVFRSYWGQKRNEGRALPVASEAKK